MAEPTMPDALQARVAAALGDQYAIEGELGRGGMSVVFAARDLRLRRRVAVKVLPPELAFRGDVRTRFLREAETAAQLSHPNIVPIYSVDEREGIVYFVMACVDGETLGERLAREPRPPIEFVRSTLVAVADALAYAHGRGVVHRDIKPDNVLLDRATGRPAVSDFGIARAAEADSRLTLTGIAVGTPAYMSPEQALGEREVDPRTDVYSLGIVAYQMLAGETPFKANNTPSMLMKHLSDRPRPLREWRADVPPALAMAVERALAKSASDRWPSAAAFRDALADERPAAPAAPTPRAAFPDAVPGTPLRVAAPEPPMPPMPQVAPPPMRGGLSPFEARVEQRILRAEWKAQQRLAKDQWRASWRAEQRERMGIMPFAERPLEERVRVFRRQMFSNGGTILFLGVINLATSPHFPWAIFPAMGMGGRLIRRWEGLSAEGASFADVMSGRAPRPGTAVSVPAEARERAVETMKRRAKITAGLAGASALSFAIGATFHADPMILPFVAFGGGAGLYGVGTAIAMSRVRSYGIRVRDAFKGTWREALRLADRRPRAERIAERASTLASAEVLAGPHGDAVRRAAAEEFDALEAVSRLPEADRALVPDIAPTVRLLMERVASLAAALHALDADVGPGTLTQLDARIAETERLAADVPDRERRLSLLTRQRATLADLASRRSTLASQLESASLVLQNMRLDLFKLRSHGVGAASGEISNATQEARALSRDIGYVLDAAAEVRKL